MLTRDGAVGRTLGEDYLEVRYEDLVLQPRKVLAELEPFIHHDLNYDRISKVGIGSVTSPNTAFEERGNDGIVAVITDTSVEALGLISELIAAKISKLGEKIAVRRFCTFQSGGKIFVSSCPLGSWTRRRR